METKTTKNGDRLSIGDALRIGGALLLLLALELLGFSVDLDSADGECVRRADP